MHLKLRHLEVFDALMQSGSVSHAAERLNVTQPAVSVALANLERELGFRLFHRTKGFFAPTGEAQLLHGEVEQGLLALARIGRRAREIREGEAGGITIASNGAAAINFLPRLIAEHHAEQPAIQIDLKVRSSRQIAAWVSGRQVDIGLIDAPVPVAGLDAEIVRLRCVCILRADDPLAAEPVIRPALLAGRAVVAITGDHPIDRQLDGLAAAAGATIRRRVSSGFFAIARNLVRAGAGIALIDPINGRMDLGDGVIWRPFEPRIDFELAMIVPHSPRDGAGGLAAGRFLARLRAAFREAGG